MKLIKEVQKAHADVRSKDETRYHLTHFYQDGRTKKLISCDGHRLLGTSLGYNAEFAGQTVDSDLILGRSFRSVGLPDVKFADISGILPSTEKFTRTFSIEVPQWFRCLQRKTISRGDTRSVTLTESGQLVIGGADKLESVVSLNLQYLAIFAGMSICLHVGDSLSPVLITDETELSTYADMDWFYVLMPMKADHRIIKELTAPKKDKDLHVS